MLGHKNVDSLSVKKNEAIDKPRRAKIITSPRRAPINLPFGPLFA